MQVVDIFFFFSLSWKYTKFNVQIIWALHFSVERMLLGMVCFTFFCELDGVNSTASVTVVMEDVSDNAFDVDLLDDPLVKKSLHFF